jgi:hypothetical protein
LIDRRRAFFCNLAGGDSEAIEGRLCVFRVHSALIRD